MIAPIAGQDAIGVRGEAALGSVIDRREREQSNFYSGGLPIFYSLT